jgi:hypothetical protein
MRHPGRPDAGREAGLVGVDIAQARQERLVEQGRLDRPPAPPDQRLEISLGQRVPDRLRPEPGKDPSGPQLVLGAQQETPELPLVVVAQLPAVVEGNPQMVCRATGSSRPQTRKWPVIPRCTTKRFGEPARGARMYLPRRLTVSTRAPINPATKAAGSG